MPDPVIAPVVTHAAWYTGKITDAETIGYLQNRGWHDKPVDVVAQEAIKAHREASAFLGVPPAQLMRLPTEPTDEAGWKAVHTRLGMPADKKDYDLSTVKDAAGKDLDLATQDAIRETAWSLNLPKDSAAKMATSILKTQANFAAAAAAEKTAALATEKATLKTNWGANYELNLATSKLGANAVGIAPETVAAFEGVVGYAGVMEMLRKIGASNREPGFKPAGGGGVDVAMTMEGALAQRAELIRDKEFVKRHIAGGSAERAKMSLINKIISGE